MALLRWGSVWPFCLPFLVLCVTPTIAATWRVAKDGTGDFYVIQQAVDASADGDTILIGPGNFEENSFAFNNTIWDVFGCINITKNNLIIIGSGMNATTVGFDVYPNPPTYTINGVNCVDDYAVAIRALRLSSCDLGVQYHGTQLVLEDCTIVDMDNGVASHAVLGTRITQCMFECCDVAFNCGSPASDVQIDDCIFNGCGDGCAVSISQTTNAIISNCTIGNTRTGIQFDQHAGGRVERCTITAIPITLAIAVGIFSSVELYNNYFEGGGYALHSDVSAVATGHGNVFYGGQNATLWIGGTGVVLHGNHFILTGALLNRLSPGLGVSYEVWKSKTPACSPPTLKRRFASA